MTSCLTRLEESVFEISCHTVDSKPVKQEVNDTVILPPLVFPAQDQGLESSHRHWER